MPENQGRLLPARAVLRPDGLYLALRDIPAAELRDAFMQETVARVAAAESFVHIERQHLGKVGGDSAPAGASRTPAEFVARLYGAFCESACRLDPNRGKLVRYEALPAAVWEAVAPHFSLRVDEDIRARMMQIARVKSKAPVGQAEQYSSDTEQKQAAATVALRQAIETLAAPSLRRLEQLHVPRS